jgi:hypothetical protein
MWIFKLLLIVAVGGTVVAFGKKTKLPVIAATAPDTTAPDNRILCRVPSRAVALQAAGKKHIVEKRRSQRNGIY